MDWADPSTASQQSFRLASAEEVQIVERSGLQLRLLEKPFNVVDFAWNEPTTHLELTALVRAHASDRVTFSIDGRAVGTQKLRPGELQEVHLPLREFKLSSGRHQLGVRLPKGRKSANSLEIAWVRLGDQARRDTQDQPTPRSEVLAEVTINQLRQPSIILREGSALRCPIWVSGSGRRLAGQVGLWGNGAGEGEIAALLEDGSQKLLASIRIDADDPRGWLPIDIDLGEFKERFIVLEWRAPQLQRGARLAFAEPLITEPPLSNAPAPPARRALLIVLSGLSHEHSPPQAAELGLPVLQRFAAEATHFPGYRTSSTSSQGAVASLLSGQPPWVHGLGEHDRAWTGKGPPLAEAVEANGGRTAFFTAVPTTFGPFGFDKGFEVFEQFSPVLDLPAVEPVRRARAWLEPQLNASGPVLAVLHLRGGHPPFDVNHEAAMELPPAEYGGDLDPRRAAIQLLGIRSRTGSGARRLPDEDWVRLAALRKRALQDQSAALTAFFNGLREKNAWDDSLIVVMGDVSSGERPSIPYDEQAALTETGLAVPLFIKFPGKHLSGRQVAGLFSTRDVFATVAQALGQPLPPHAISLNSPRAEHDARQRPHVAYRGGHYATRLGPYLLIGQEGKTPRLCRVDVDPSCSLDRAEVEAVPLRALWLATYQALHDPLSHPPQRVDLPENDELAAAMMVWGIIR